VSLPARFTESPKFPVVDGGDYPFFFFFYSHAACRLPSSQRKVNPGLVISAFRPAKAVLFPFFFHCAFRIQRSFSPLPRLSPPPTLAVIAARHVYFFFFFFCCRWRPPPFSQCKRLLFFWERREFRSLARSRAASFSPPPHLDEFGFPKVKGIQFITFSNFFFLWIHKRFLSFFPPVRATMTVSPLRFSLLSIAPPPPPPPLQRTRDNVFFQSKRDVWIPPPPPSVFSRMIFLLIPCPFVRMVLFSDVRLGGTPFL